MTRSDIVMYSAVGGLALAVLGLYLAHGKTSPHMAAPSGVSPPMSVSVGAPVYNFGQRDRASLYSCGCGGSVASVGAARLDPIFGNHQQLPAYTAAPAPLATPPAWLTGNGVYV